MTDEQKRIKIAEACGFRIKYYKSADELPNYLNSLDAMHQAEMTLTKAQQETYTIHLLSNISESICDLDPLHANWLAAHTPAYQRAEAFLKAIEA